MKLNEEKLTDEALKQYLFDNLAKETKSLSSKQLATTFNSVSVDEIVKIVQNQERMYFLSKEEKETLKEILNDYIDWYDDELKITENHTTMSKKCKIIKNILEKLGE